METTHPHHFTAYRSAMATKANDATLEGSAAILDVLIAAARYDVERNAGGGSDLDAAQQTLRELLKISDGITNARFAN